MWQLAHLQQEIFTGTERFVDCWKDDVEECIPYGVDRADVRRFVLETRMHQLAYLMQAGEQVGRTIPEICDVLRRRVNEVVLGQPAGCVETAFLEARDRWSQQAA